MAENPKIERICGICEKPLPPDTHGNRLYHSGCDDVARERALIVVGEKRKVARGKGYPKSAVCGIKGCGKEFEAQSHRNKYCSDACRVKGWEAAMERVREMRRREKRNRRESDSSDSVGS